MTESPPHFSSADNAESDDKSSVTLSPAQAKFLYWFTGLIQIPKALTPISTYWGDIRKPLLINGKVPTPGVRSARLYLNVVTDACRQTVTCTFQLVSYFIGGDLFKTALKLLPHEDKGEQSDEQRQKEAASQQMMTQVISLLIQVTATILSRPYGATQLIRLFQQEEKPAESVPGKWHNHVNQWLNRNLRNPANQHLLPGKAASLVTLAIFSYLGVLVGVLYGISSLLEKAFPDTYKSKGKQAGKPEKSKPPAPMEINAIKPFSPYSKYSDNTTPFSFSSPSSPATLPVWSVTPPVQPIAASPFAGLSTPTFPVRPIPAPFSY